MAESASEFKSLVQIMHRLRAPGGCPWDREQTHESLAKFALEEAHELADAISLRDDHNLLEELGDVLLQVLFHAEIAAEENRFTIREVIQTLSEKLIRRHPHVFAETKVNDSDEVLKNWEQIKSEEKKNQEVPHRLGAPVGQPGLMRAQKIGKKTRKENFDWPTVKEVIQQLRSEIKELEEEVSGKDLKKLNHELGDILFTVAQIGRHLDLDSEQSLKDANNRFEDRYLTMRKLAEEQNLAWESLPDPDKEALWGEAKKRCSGKTS